MGLASYSPRQDHRGFQRLQDHPRVKPRQRAKHKLIPPVSLLICVKMFPVSTCA